MIEEESIPYTIYGDISNKQKLMNIWSQEIEIIKLCYLKCKGNNKVTLFGTKACFQWHLRNSSTYKLI